MRTHRRDSACVYTSIYIKEMIVDEKNEYEEIYIKKSERKFTNKKIYHI